MAFSCKGRGLCPSCNSRRAHDTATHLLEKVLPHVPFRQWTLSFPIRLRWALATDSRPCSSVLALFVRVVFGHLRRAVRQLRRDAGECGAISFVQRFGSALQLNVHFHVLVPEGVFRSDGSFASLPPPDDDAVHAVLERFLESLSVAERAV